MLIKKILVILLLAISFIIGRRTSDYGYNPYSGSLEHLQTYTVYNANIVMFGDSHIKNGKWKEILKRRDIAEEGYGGYTSLDLMIKLEHIEKMHPGICFLMVGINDIQRGISSDSYNKYMNIIISRLKAHSEVVLHKILYVNNDFPKSEYINARVDVFNKTIDTLAGKYDLSVIDMRSELCKDGYIKTQYCRKDNIHLTDEAYRIWGEKITTLLSHDNRKQGTIH